MQLQEQRYEVPLPGIDRPAAIVLSRRGQQDPSDGDAVIVRWELHLPAQDGALVPEIDLGPGAILAGTALHSRWGCWGANYRVRDGQECAKTWAEAWRLAEAYVRGELGRLIDALEARQKALEEAEDE